MFIGIPWLLSGGWGCNKRARPLSVYLQLDSPGKYSARIFEKLGHTLHCKVVYDEFRDEAGELLLR